jgi:hypothetical protein
LIEASLSATIATLPESHFAARSLDHLATIRPTRFAFELNARSIRRENSALSRIFFQVSRNRSLDACDAHISRSSKSLLTTSLAKILKIPGKNDFLRDMYRM